MKKKTVEKKRNYGRWGFLLGVVLLYLILGLANPNLITASLNFFWLIIKKIIPVFFIVFIFMAVVNYFISPKKIQKYFGKGAGIKGWIIVIFSGLVSTGPIYMWLPLIREVKSKGVKLKYVVAFLYNRAIKLPLLPLLIFYFGWNYMIVLSLVMIICSVLQGMIVEKMLEG